MRKVILYKNGMGYFERVGEVRDTQDLEIAFPSAQLNDVLKSLTVIDLGRGQVAGVTYDSAAPLDRRLAELPVQMDSAQSVLEFLNKIRGTEVELRPPGGPVLGKLMGAELRRKQVGEYTVREAIEVVVFTPQGELRTVELAPSTALKLMEKGLAADVGHYLELLDSAHQRAVRRLKIHATGSGTRRLQVSYTSEAPIWKTTYRLVLDQKQKPLLQGWAIVDNTTPTDWVDVDLSLVTGAPVSFVQDLSQPLYARRPVVPLPEGVQVTPQTHEATLEAPTGQTAISGVVKDMSGGVIPGAGVTVLDEEANPVKQVTTDHVGRYRVEVPPGTYRMRAGSPGFQIAAYRGVVVNPGRVTALDFTLQVGAVATTVEVQAAPAEIQTSTSSVSRGAAKPGAGGGLELGAWWPPCRHLGRPRQDPSAKLCASRLLLPRRRRRLESSSSTSWVGR